MTSERRIKACPFCQVHPTVHYGPVLNVVGSGQSGLGPGPYRAAVYCRSCRARSPVGTHDEDSAKAVDKAITAWNRVTSTEMKLRDEISDLENDLARHRRDREKWDDEEQDRWRLWGGDPDEVLYRLRLALGLNHGANATEILARAEQLVAAAETGEQCRPQRKPSLADLNTWVLAWSGAEGWVQMSAAALHGSPTTDFVWWIPEPPPPPEAA